jgi:hypothetical protein
MGILGKYYGITRPLSSGRILLSTAGQGRPGVDSHSAIAAGSGGRLE